ncbi:MAG: PIN/TRAM domain-containing protein [Veillonellaceae bacterium]|nr:PIN/TRAM domain-containing protein [Veillonellaceae bacterium]
MIEKVLRTTFICLFMIIGVVLAVQLYPLVESFGQPDFLSPTVLYVVTAVAGGVIGGLVGISVSPFLLRQLRAFAAWGERTVTGISLTDLLLGVAGLLVGLLIANLLGMAFSNLPLVGPYVSIVLNIVLGYTGMYLAIGQKDKMAGMVHAWRAGREKDGREKTVRGTGKVLDTSVVIDGRIADIAKTGFLEGPLIVPVFVLEELQYIADSADVLKRNRGRRGLDILNEMQKKKIIEVQIVTDDFEDIGEVDSKLIQLCRKNGTPIITNDYNLNKVAELQGVRVLNINDLANSVKPVVIPGEQLQVDIVKPGKEEGQGIAYLDDGTMIVIEDGRRQIGNHVFVVVTSVLQTSAGKMIFARYEEAGGEQ